MTKQAINVGTTANDKKGDSLRAAFQKVNANFTELYEAVGLAATGQDTALTFLGSTLSTDDSSSIVIDRATTVTSNLSVGGDIIPQTANGGDLGSSTLPWRSLYVSNNTIYIGGTAVGVDANGNLTTGGTVVGSTPAWNTITGKPTFAAVATSGAYYDLTGRPTSFNSLVTGAYSVNLESGGVLRANVQGIVSDNQLAVEGSTLISIQTLDGPYLQLFNQGATKEINLVLYDGESLNPTWTFDTDRTLTLPNDSSIKSATNIDITVDTPDSSTFNWRFGADGDLTFPDGTTTTGKSITVPVGQTFDFNLSTSEPPPGSTSKISITSSGLSTDQSILYLGTSNSKYWNLDSDQQRIQFNDSSADVIFGTKTKNNTGGINDIELFSFGADGGAGAVHISAGSSPTNNRWTFDASGSLQIPGDIKSNSNINIEINLADSTLRRWQFGEDGLLTFPDGTSQTTAWTGIPGPYADDEAAALAGVALGSPYHKTGTGGQVFVRLTSPT